jgi:lincosamide nucleotidyltransferase B/F
MDLKTVASGSHVQQQIQQRALTRAADHCHARPLLPAARAIRPGPPLVRDEEAAGLSLPGASLGHMLVQERLIARVREVCHADQRMDAALMYGSFAHGEGDAHSDVEFWLFFAPGQRAGVDPRAWCAQIAPLTHLVVKEFGTHVAFFPHLIRGEFHFAASADIAEVRSWPARGAPAGRMIVLDRDGSLRAALDSLPGSFPLTATGKEAETMCGRFANWFVLAHHVTERGEILRALDALAQVQRHLLWMTRLAEGQTGHWLTPSRRAEADLTPQAVTALKQTTASTATADDVRRALQAAWRYGRACWQQLAQRYATSTPDALFAELDEAITSP